MSVSSAVSDNLVIIIIPLFALLALAIQFIVIPIFAGMAGSGSASTGLINMGATLASFAPIYGVGLAIGMLVMFFGQSIAGFQPYLFSYTPTYSRNSSLVRQEVNTTSFAGLSPIFFQALLEKRV